MRKIIITKSVCILLTLLFAPIWFAFAVIAMPFILAKSLYHALYLIIYGTYKLGHHSPLIDFANATRSVVEGVLYK